MNRLTALYDSCVLYPAPLRDLLMWLAITDLFHARWSEQIHEEWISNLLDHRPDLKRQQLERTRGLMDAKVEDCLVTGYEPLIDQLSLPDPDDRHVLAAAIKARATVIVTYNLKDFPSAALDKHNITAQHPDDFVSELIEAAPQVVLKAVEEHRQSLTRPPKTREQYLETLGKQGLDKTVKALKLLLEQETKAIDVE